VGLSRHVLWENLRWAKFRGKERTDSSHSGNQPCSSVMSSNYHSILEFRQVRHQQTISWLIFIFVDANFAWIWEMSGNLKLWLGTGRSPILNLSTALIWRNLQLVVMSLSPWSRKQTLTVKAGSLPTTTPVFGCQSAQARTYLRYSIEMLLLQLYYWHYFVDWTGATSENYYITVQRANRLDTI